MKIFSYTMMLMSLLLFAISINSGTLYSQYMVQNEQPCETFQLPSFSELTSNPKLPDPFRFLNGRRMSTIQEWICRRTEIAALAQEFIYGYKPPVPDTITTTYNSTDSTLTVFVTEEGKTISFRCKIYYPQSGTPPYPAMISIGFSFYTNNFTQLGIAVIIFPNDSIAQQAGTHSRGRGKFYELYGSNHSASALMAWAWGVDCLISALEKTPEANINPSKLGITGCSRNGKGALCAGAFCERIVLTIPQESGCGGTASWRISQAQKDDGQNVQTASHIVTENVWLRSNFNQFGYAVNKLPLDQHMVMALCAPRALLTVENTSMEWLGNVSSWSSANAAHYVWELLGVPDRMGCIQNGYQYHCVYTQKEWAWVVSYVQRFLLDNNNVNTTVMETDGNYTFDKDRWIDWETVLKIDDKEESFNPGSFKLYQNYPNPFNPITTINYTLNTRSYVSLKVFDSLGREVAVLVSEEKDKGNYSEQWNASEFPSGVYYYRLQTESYVDVKKLIVLK